MKLSFGKYLILLNSHLIHFTFCILWVSGRVLDRLQGAGTLKSRFSKSFQAHNPHFNGHHLSKGQSSTRLVLRALQPPSLLETHLKYTCHPSPRPPSAHHTPPPSFVSLPTARELCLEGEQGPCLTQLLTSMVLCLQWSQQTFHHLGT